MKSGAYQEKHFHFTVRKKLIKTKPFTCPYKLIQTHPEGEREIHREKTENISNYIHVFVN